MTRQECKDGVGGLEGWEDDIRGKFWGRGRGGKYLAQFMQHHATSR